MGIIPHWQSLSLPAMLFRLLVGKLYHWMRPFDVFVILWFFLVVHSEKKLPARFNMELFNKLQIEFATKFFTPDTYDGCKPEEKDRIIHPAVYDGHKNAFTMYQLPLHPNDSGQVLLLFCTNWTMVTYNISLVQCHHGMQRTPFQWCPPSKGLHHQVNQGSGNKYWVINLFFKRIMLLIVFFKDSTSVHQWTAVPRQCCPHIYYGECPNNCSYQISY